MPRDPVITLLAAYPVVHHALRQRDLKTAGGAKVSAHQATVLAHLLGAAGVTVSHLAAQVGVALPTISLLIDRLERGGMVRREKDPADGRRVLVALTDAGVRIVKGRSLLDPDRVRALLAVLTPAERATGVEGLVTLARAVDRLATTPRLPRGRS